MNNQRFLRRRLINIGVKPSVARSLSTRFQHQVDNQGEEGACAYFKRVGDTLLHYLTGSGEKPPWVKTHHGFPVVFNGLQGYPEEVLLRVAKIARSLRLDAPTDSQVRKVRDAVITPFNGCDRAVSEASHLVVIAADHFLSPRDCDLTDYPLVARQFRRVQSVSGRTSTTAEPPLKDSLEIVKSLKFLQRLPEWEKVFAPLSPDDVREAVALVDGNGPAVGEIHAAQENGCKLRMFASPYTVVQSLLSPMHDFFDAFRRQLPTDCTYNQSAGAEFAQRAIREGRTVHSVDLSTATCRFPWKVQEELAIHLGLPDPHIEALRRVSQGTWRVGKELVEPFGRRTLRWAVGQPLGIKPSMSMFSLTHNLLLAALCRLHGCEPSETFRVLGDDVVIVNDDVADEYRGLITRLGIPISWNKSHSSDSYAEFAGYSITKNTMLRPGRWKTASLTNWESLAVELGTPLRGEVSIAIRQAQKLALFSRGLYNPPVDRWPFWIRALSTLNEGSSFEFKSTAPLWFDTIRRKWTLILREIGVRYPGFDPSYDLSFSSVLRSIRRYTDGLPCYHSNSGWSFMEGSIPVRTMALVMILEIDHHNGHLTQEDFDEAVRTVENKANALLYQPPRNKGPREHARIDSFVKAIDTAKTWETEAVCAAVS